MKNSYLSIIFNEKRTPKTKYPYQLINYLVNRFNITTNMNVLEIGCGRCDFLDEFNKMGITCYGVDKEIYPKLYNKDLVKSCNVSHNTLPFKNNSIDVIYHKSLIEHMYDPSHLMSESLRVLRPNGKIIILTPDWETQWKTFYGDFTHCRPYTVLSIEDLLKINNFNNLEVEKFYMMPIFWKHPIIKIISKLLQLFIPIKLGRWLADKTKITFFRWSVELMILGYGEKHEHS